MEPAFTLADVDETEYELFMFEARELRWAVPHQRDAVVATVKEVVAKFKGEGFELVEDEIYGLRSRKLKFTKTKALGGLHFSDQAEVLAMPVDIWE